MAKANDGETGTEATPAVGPAKASPVTVGPQPPKDTVGATTKKDVPPAKDSVGPVTTPTPPVVGPVANPNVGVHTDDAILKDKLAGYPLASWPENDQRGAEKQAMLDCVTGRRMTRPTGTEGLLRRLEATGTSRYNLKPFWAMLPRDRYGVQTGDLPAAACLDAMLKTIEEDEMNPDVSVPRLDRLTYEKAQQIAKFGYWKPISVYQERIPNAMPDEVFEPAAA